MSRLLIIGCGGVASVAVHKCCQNSEVFTEIMIASRTVSKCEALKAELEGKTSTKITTAKVDADNVDELAALMESYKPDAVLNLALPYQDLTIMDACLKAGVNYIDTANYEPEDTDDPEWRAIYEKRCKEEGFTAYFDYSWQWAYKERFEKAGLMALLGTGFDPGVTSVFTAYALKHYFDEIHTLIQLADFYGVELRELLDGERKPDAMNTPETKSATEETARKVADYSNDVMEKVTHRFHYMYLISIATVLIYLVMNHFDFSGSPVLQGIQGACLGIGLGMLIVGAIFTSKRGNGALFFKAHRLNCPNRK